MAVVYLLHFDHALAGAGHFLGTASAEAAIPASADQLPPSLYGERVRRAREVIGAVVVSDVWEVDSPTAADQLLKKFRKQGSRRRLCSVCTPGNGRGDGRGKYVRRAAGAVVDGRTSTPP